MKHATFTARSQRVLIYLSLALATAYGLAYYYLLEFWPPPPPTLDASQVVALYAHANLKFRLGVAVMILSGAFFLPWCVVISAQMLRVEQGLPVWTIMQSLAGTIGAWLIAFPPVFWGIASFTVNRDPALTVLMHEFAWLIFTSPVSFWPFQMLSIAVIALFGPKDVEHSAFPRWIGWLSAWTALGGTLGGMSQVFKSGPFAWNGLFSFYFPVIFTAAWMTGMSFSMLHAIRCQERGSFIHSTGGAA